MAEARPDEARRQHRFKKVPLRFLLPNLITLLALSSGITAIRLGVQGRFELAVGAVIIAILLDAIDGRLARLLKGTSRFGAELDSLADFVNFGVAPAMLVYFWTLNQLQTAGWIISLVLAICCALRLARFNVALDDPDKPAWTVGFFTGAPAPAGAGLAMLPLYLGFLDIIEPGRLAALIFAPYIVAVAVLMVSRVPTFSGKNLGRWIPRDMVLPILGLVVFAMILLVSYPWEFLSLLALVYIGLLPLGIRSYRRHQQADAAAEAAKSQP
ncbi:MAG: CDP-diacylglycerol--serine O-phosphatidyltransferase [Rhizobiales bacterium]|nr:CDP-diacylglycerol--serine O-phosphatidyltransferase [Hyphomicrobiales bacterium]MBI3673118.1 CDP-diacylglycerol--serine O-phosphatidyltransferase [Hyphomicrobiales bacterium]